MRQGEKAVLVTIVSAHGSVPRGAGAQMLVRSDGTCMGTIGGGAVEYRAGLEAMNAMRAVSYTHLFLPMRRSFP